MAMLESGRAYFNHIRDVTGGEKILRVKPMSCRVRPTHPTAILQ
jgi:hypothetical protein